MKVALISDIHGNLVALDAVLAEIEREGVDEVICLGDIAGTGPRPHEVVERLRARHIRSVRGNVDDEVLDHEPSDGQDPLLRKMDEITSWCTGQLTPEDLDYLRSAPATITVDLSGGAQLLCYHGSPRSNQETIVATTPEAELGRILEGQNAAVMAGGHTHEPLIRRFRHTLLVNPGSVGLPLERLDRVRNPAWAEYAMVRRDGRDLGVELRRVALDTAAVRRSATESDMPHAAWWAADWTDGGSDD